MPPAKQPHLRCDVLIAWVRERVPGATMNGIAEYLDVNARSLWRWALDDIPFHTADAIAVRMGVHPAEIWGDAYWDQPVEEPA